MKTTRVCRNCGVILTTHQYSFCSNKCQAELRYKSFIQTWLGASKRNEKVSVTKNISRHIKRYLLEQNKERCSICKWCKRHPNTERVPLEVDHIDGNAENNHLSNLRLLCPNCHALTPHFRNLNKGNGRKWRKM